MRGPGMRLKLDVRRMWQCPRCGAQRKLPAHVTTVRCQCVSEPTFMKIVEPQRLARPVPKPLNLVLNIDLDTPDENDARPAATEVVTAVVVESVTVREIVPPSPSPLPAGGPPRRDDRRNKPGRQRDRRPGGNRQSYNAEQTNSPQLPAQAAAPTPPVHQTPNDQAPVIESLPPADQPQTSSQPTAPPLTPNP